MLFVAAELEKLMVGTVTMPPPLLSMVSVSPVLPLMVTLMVEASGWLCTTVAPFFSSRLEPLTSRVRLVLTGALKVRSGKTQPVSLPEVTEFGAVIVVTALLSLTSRKLTLLVPWESIWNCVGEVAERSDNRLPEAPFRVRVLVTVVLLAAPVPNFRMAGAATDLVRLLKVVAPLRDWSVPLRVTVPPLAAKVPPVRLKSPLSLKVLAELGAVKVPVV